MKLQEILNKFEAVKQNKENSYQCKCPSHQDMKASLTISQESGKILLHCHANCDTSDILAAVGLSFEDLKQKTENKHDWKERLEYSKKKKIEAIYDYKDKNSVYLYSKVRFEEKEIVYMRINRKKDTYEYGAGDREKTLYNLPAVIKAIKDGFTVYITEGEKDVDTLTRIGLVATTAGSVSDWKKEYAKYFTGAKVIILPDNDEVGLQLKDRIIKDLRNYAHFVKSVITSHMHKGDVTDYLEEHTKEELKQLVTSTDEILAPWLYTVGKEKNIKINGDILAHCISLTLHYLIIRRPDDDKDDIYLYDSGVYKKCNRNQLKSAIRKYVPVGLASDSMLNNVVNLLMCKETNLCHYKELDCNEDYINLKNGLYNLKTRKLEPHTYEIYSTLQLDCEYRPEQLEMPHFTQYMIDLCSDVDGVTDKSKLSILQEFIGMFISNVKVSRLKSCLVLYSLLGNSGKSQLLSLIGNMLGEEKTINIPLQHMNEKSKFLLGSILGKRLISIGDQQGSDIEDSSIFKQLTGGDEIKIEPKNKQPFSMRFNGGILIACNNLPNFKDDKGGHVFERMCIVPCMNTIPLEKRDSMLLDKILKEKNAIFNWFLQGLHRLIDNNYKVTESEACKEVIREYRSKLDTIYHYINEFYIITDNKMDMILKTKFEADYIKWCEQIEVTALNKSNIKERMEKNGVIANKGNIGNQRGVMVYRNIKEKEEDFKEITKEIILQEKLPFS